MIGRSLGQHHFLSISCGVCLFQRHDGDQRCFVFMCSMAMPWQEIDPVQGLTSVERSGLDCRSNRTDPSMGFLRGGGTEDSMDHILLTADFKGIRMRFPTFPTLGVNVDTTNVHDGDIPTFFPKEIIASFTAEPMKAFVSQHHKTCLGLVEGVGGVGLFQVPSQQDTKGRFVLRLLAGGIWCACKGRGCLDGDGRGSKNHRRRRRRRPCSGGRSTRVCVASGLVLVCGWWGGRSGAVDGCHFFLVCLLACWLLSKSFPFGVLLMTSYGAMEGWV